MVLFESYSSPKEWWAASEIASKLVAASNVQGLCFIIDCLCATSFPASFLPRRSVREPQISSALAASVRHDNAADQRRFALASAFEFNLRGIVFHYNRGTERPRQVCQTLKNIARLLASSGRGQPACLEEKIIRVFVLSVSLTLANLVLRDRPELYRLQ